MTHEYDLNTIEGYAEYLDSLPLKDLREMLWDLLEDDFALIFDRMDTIDMILDLEFSDEDKPSETKQQCGHNQGYDYWH